ncbi:hypothetical protein BX600DRAFT_80005 [Xylariales sp. PMI_506]|nr:hypothetical protein BX600DRAFT_80005 [Xylariales sp. PMI_506]
MNLVYYIYLFISLVLFGLLSLLGFLSSYPSCMAIWGHGVYQGALYHDICKFSFLPLSPPATKITGEMRSSKWDMGMTQMMEKVK